MSDKDDLNYELLKFYIDVSRKDSLMCNLYHYTSPDGLEKILNKHRLWFTRYDCLNDYSERKYLLNVYASVCEKFKKRRKNQPGVLR